jgi:PAS domain S-box-containing protein
MFRILTTSLLLFLLLCTFSSYAWSTPVTVTRHVLILNSYHQGFKWSDQIIEGVRSSLLEANAKINIHIEHMDTKRFPRQDPDALAKSYADKYKTLDLDLIVSADDNAFNFIKKYRNQISEDAPLIFCGVNYLTQDKLNGLTNYTGVNETADFKGTIDLILKIHPRVKRIISITDLTTSGQINKKIIDPYRKSYSSRVEIIPWDDLSYAELIERLGQLSKGDIVLFTSFFRDKLGQSFEYDEIAEEITAASPVPTYGSWDYNLGHGIVGGRLASGFYQGSTAGSFGVRILNGESAAAIPLEWQSPNRNMFDAKQLNRFNIDSADLPSEAVIINHSTAIHEKHRTLILSLSAATLVLLGIILFLVANTRRRIRAEKQLRLSQMRYHDLSELLPQTVFEIDDKGMMAYVNQFGLTWSGYSQEDISAGFPGLRLFHPDDQVRVEENIARINQGAPLQGNEYRVIKKNGDITPVLSYSRPFQREDGSTGLRGVLTDVSAIHRAEHEAMLTRLYLKNVVDLMPTILIGTDRDGVVNLWNEHAVKITGVTPEEAHNRLLSEILPPLTPEQSMVRTALIEGQTLSETRVRRNISDEDRYWDIRIYPLSLQDLDSAIIYIDDVSDQIQMEKVMIQTEKMVSVGGLAAGMAHEINNPIGAILQSTQVLSNRLFSAIPANIQAAEECDIPLAKIGAYMEARSIPSMLDVILKSGYRVADIIKDISSFSRNVDDSSAAKSDVDIHELLAQALNFAKKDHVHYDFNNIEVQEEYGEIPLVHCSKTQIQQVLLNLIKNGAEAMATWEQMPAAPKFIIRTSRIKDSVRIEIEDNGPGISEEIQKRIFEPFYTTKTHNIGTGLGLSISYFIISQNHNGAIDLVSSPGNGARFIIDLPIS